jgi:hypothetical protein
LVVGAPYEGLGAVYVYLGSKSRSPSTVFHMSQRIYASDIVRATGLHTFGYSFADTRGTDIDLNGYPDMVVGAYASDTVVLLRTRPVIDVQTTMSSTPDVVNPAVTHCLDGSPNSYFNVTMCFKFTAMPLES